MLYLRVKDILTFGGLTGAKIVAGHDGAGNFVESISVLEVANPQIAQWVTRNELYITSFYAIKDDIDMQKRVIETLARCTCCGLIICHIEQWVKKIDPEIIRICDELKFPLVVARTEVSYVEILNPIIGKLYKPEISAVDYSKINTEFLDLIVDEDDVQIIYGKIAKALELEISLFDIYYGCIFSNKEDERVMEEKWYLQENMREVSIISSQTYYQYTSPQGRTNIIYLIKSQKNFFGYIVIEVPDQALLERYLEVASSLSLTCSLIFNKKSKLGSISDIQREEYLVNLIVWNFLSVEVAIKSGINLGYDITGKHNLVLVNINQFQKLQFESEKQALTSYVKRWILPSINDIVKSYCDSNIAGFRSDTVILLLENADGSLDLPDICRRILHLFETGERTTASIGVSGRMNTVTDIPAAYTQAFHAAIIGRQLHGVNRMVTYEEIYYFHRIKVMGRESENRAYCQKWVQPVMDYDRAKGTNLMETFERLVLYSADVSEMAEDMYIHRNTLLYRKNRIIEILGYNPFEMPYLFNFIIAFLMLGDIGQTELPEE